MEAWWTLIKEKIGSVCVCVWKYSYLAICSYMNDIIFISLYLLNLLLSLTLLLSLFFYVMLFLSFSFFAHKQLIFSFRSFQVFVCQRRRTWHHLGSLEVVWSANLRLLTLAPCMTWWLGLLELSALWTGVRDFTTMVCCDYEADFVGGVPFIFILRKQ